MSATTDVDTEAPGDGVMRISLVRPQGAPTVDIDVMREAVADIEAAGPQTRAILISHVGKNFCLGGDVSAFAGSDHPGRYVKDIADVLHAAIRCLVESPYPVVAAVQGWAAGAGMSIVTAADIAIAGTSTKLRAAYPSLGFTPDGGMSWTLPRAVGRTRALDIILTNRTVAAEEALAIGLFSRIVADDAVEQEAGAVAAILAAGSPGASAGIKRLINEGAGRDLRAQLDAEATSIAARADSVDGREGVRAFVERRTPRFE